MFELLTLLRGDGAINRILDVDELGEGLVVHDFRLLGVVSAERI